MINSIGQNNQPLTPRANALTGGRVPDMGPPAEVALLLRQLREDPLEQSLDIEQLLILLNTLQNSVDILVERVDGVEAIVNQMGLVQVMELPVAPSDTRSSS
jgi:hypothetical protein